MRTDTLAQTVEQQVVEILSGIAGGVPVQSLTRAACRILRIFHEDKESLPSSYARLTSREAEVLELIAEGFANKQIAGELAISIKTVEKHRQHLMAKLDLHGTADLTRYAISAGVVPAVA